LKVLIITDIHANYRALTAILERFSDVDEVWCLGDIVEIGPCPALCIDLIRKTCRYVVKGNHDESFARFDPATAHSEWNGWEHQSTTSDQLDYLHRLPLIRKVTCDGATYHLVHGSPSDPLTGRLTYDTEGESPRDAVDHLDGVLCGHTHVAMILNVDGKWIVNAGSVGQPRDGDYRAQCMILEDGVFSYHLVAYDLDAMERDYRQSSMPAHVIEEWIRNTRQGMVERHGLRKGPLSRS
jgi:putative phosphoesterase